MTVETTAMLHPSFKRCIKQAGVYKSKQMTGQRWTTFFSRVYQNTFRYDPQWSILIYTGFIP